MALVLRNIYAAYTNHFVSKEGDIYTHYPLMSSPVPVLVILVSYLYFVKNCGPAWMANRKPFELKGMMMAYNAFQIIANLGLAWKAYYYTYYQPHFKFSCQELANPGTERARVELDYTYLYFALKVIDLLDTVFFVLRKKNNQISFLHVYHHAGMVAMIWSATKFAPGGHASLLGIVNCLVHVCMYSYYLLSTISDSVKTSLWWKKHITQVQLAQFVILLFHFGRPLIFHTCGYPRPWLFVAFVQNLFMVALFGDFYIKAYVAKKTK